MPARYRITLSRQAGTDLERISANINLTSAQNAPRVIHRILDAIDLLQHFPHRSLVAGQRKGVRHPVRSVPVQSWIIFFAVLEKQQTVRILRVRHGSQRRLKRYD